MQSFFVIMGIIGVGMVWYGMTEGSPNAKLVKKLCENKTPEESKVIEYFVAEGCMVSTMPDEEYLDMVIKKRDGMDFKKMAIAKIGLDEDEINEIPPAMFRGFTFNDAYAKRLANGDWVSSKYEVSWIFFSSTQVYIYVHSFSMDDSSFKAVYTREFFYKDVTSFSTSSKTETTRFYEAAKNAERTVTSNKFTLIVPGDSLPVAMESTPEDDEKIQAMKHKLREKKQQA